MTAQIWIFEHLMTYLNAVINRFVDVFACNTLSKRTWNDFAQCDLVAFSSKEGNFFFNAPSLYSYESFGYA
jgi:hypothetical protein